MEDNKMTSSLQPILSVAIDQSTNTYTVKLARGSSVPETAFCVSIIVKAFLKDKIIKTPKEFMDLVNKYLTDPQFNEVTDAKDTNKNNKS